MPKLKIDWQQVEDHIEGLVLEAAAEALPGEDKAKKVVRQAARWLDDKLEFGPGPVGMVAEALDGPVLRAILGSFTQHVYDRLQAAGRV